MTIHEPATVGSGECLICGNPATVELHEVGFPRCAFCSRACLKLFVLNGFRLDVKQERMAL